MTGAQERRGRPVTRNRMQEATRWVAFLFALAFCAHFPTRPMHSGAGAEDALRWRAAGHCGARPDSPRLEWEKGDLPAAGLRCSIEVAYQAADALPPRSGRASSPPSKQISPSGCFLCRFARRELTKKGQHRGRALGAPERSWVSQRASRQAPDTSSESIFQRVNRRSPGTENRLRPEAETRQRSGKAPRPAGLRRIWQLKALQSRKAVHANPNSVLGSCAAHSVWAPAFG